ncbi:MAG: cytochrome c [Pseudomonadota bacterium]
MAKHPLPTLSIIAAASLVLVSACSGDAAPEGDGAPKAGEPEVIDARQANFKKLGDSFKAIRTQLEGDSPDMAVIESAALDLNIAALATKDQFPEGTSVADGWDTEALATIWEKPEEFAKAHQMIADRSAEMVKLAQAGDPAAVAAYVKDLGGSCKNCHDNFRLDDG